MQKKKMRRNILLIKIKDCMVFVHILRELQVKIFLNSANVHFQNKGKDLSYYCICYLKSEKKINYSSIKPETTCQISELYCLQLTVSACTINISGLALQIYVNVYQSYKCTIPKVHSDLVR